MWKKTMRRTPLVFRSVSDHLVGHAQAVGPVGEVGQARLVVVVEVHAPALVDVVVPGVAHRETADRQPRGRDRARRQIAASSGATDFSPDEASTVAMPARLARAPMTTTMSVSVRPPSASAIASSVLRLLGPEDVPERGPGEDEARRRPGRRGPGWTRGPCPEAERGARRGLPSTAATTRTTRTASWPHR